ncbi:hypothetical protein FCV25MIE_04804 [Fagus crenata]
MGRASPIWSLGFATRRLSGAVRGGLREEEVERRGGTSFADLVTGLRNEAVERHGGTSFADLVNGLRDEAVAWLHDERRSGTLGFLALGFAGFAGFVVFLL